MLLKLQALFFLIVLTICLKNLEKKMFFYEIILIWLRVFKTLFILYNYPRKEETSIFNYSQGASDIFMFPWCECSTTFFFSKNRFNFMLNQHTVRLFLVFVNFGGLNSAFYYIHLFQLHFITFNAFVCCKQDFHIILSFQLHLIIVNAHVWRHIFAHYILLELFLCIK